ncbi:MAG: cobalamin-dependent protein, partial [Magnetococcales bacterium]|nr:cobalamin-dependent protein [Magnetococcales bacterium]
MKILFISAPKAIESQEILEPLFATPPTTHLWLAAVLIREGYEVVILDAIAKNFSAQEIIRSVAHEQPDVVGFTVFTCAFYDVVYLANKLKEQNPQLVIMAGGYHANSVPDDFKQPCFDYTIVGEGERSFVQLLNGLRDQKEELHLVPNLIYFDRHNQIWQQNPPAPYIPSFDDHPILPYSLVADIRYNTWWTTIDHDKHKFMAIVTGKGCPMECSFCDISKTEGYKYRMMSAERVIQELEHLISLGFTHIEIRDPLFMISTNRVARIAQKIIQR